MIKPTQDPDEDYAALLSLCRNAQMDGSLSDQMASLFLALDAQILRGNAPREWASRIRMKHDSS
jgi:hypothetical protein